MDCNFNLIPHCSDLMYNIELFQNEVDDRMKIISDEKNEYVQKLVPLIHNILDIKLYNMFTEYFVKLILDGIKSHINDVFASKDKYEIKLHPKYHYKFVANVGNHYKSYKMHEILYGKIKGGPLFLWTNREQQEEDIRNPFKDLQTRLYREKQMILLDKSDCSISYLPYIVLMFDLPDNYFDAEYQVLWHGLNKLPNKLHLELQLDYQLETYAMASSENWEYEHYDNHFDSPPFNYHDEIFADPRE